MAKINVSNYQIGESLPEQIAKYILEKIMTKELKPGDKIVEESFAKQLNTSRAPVREALYLLQIDHIVERIPRKGTVVKSFTNDEIKEYVDAMVGLIHMALEFSKGKWTSEYHEELDKKLSTMTGIYQTGDLFAYQQASNLLTGFLFEVAGNQPLRKFYYESVYILNVFAKVKWTKKTMDAFHVKMESLVQCIKENKIEKAKEVIPHLLLDTLQD